MIGAFIKMRGAPKGEGIKKKPSDSGRLFLSLCCMHRCTLYGYIDKPTTGDDGSPLPAAPFAFIRNQYVT